MKLMFVIVYWVSTALPEEIILVIMEWGGRLGVQVSCPGSC